MDQLFQLKEKTEEKKRLESQLKKTIADYKETEKKLAQLSALLKKEFNDVQKLESIGLTAFFYSFLGNKVEKLDKERQEYLAAKLKYENCKNELDKLLIEIENIESRIVNLGNPEANYRNFINLKSIRFRENKDDKFLKYEMQLETHLQEKNEINEAIEAGEMAMKGLRQAIQTLRKAKNWGIYDMVGGGFIATAIKHSNIDEAKSIILDVQVWLKKFKRELSDVRILNAGELSVQLDSFTTFADYFFDNLIFDWVVQEKINRSLEGCETICKQVNNLVTQLRIEDVDIAVKCKETRSILTAYIEKSGI